MRHTRSAGSAISRFVDGRGGELRRADFHVRTDPDAIANRRAAVAAPERPAVAEASVAAGSDRNWFDGQSAGIEWLFPAPEHNPRSSAVRIAIKHLPGQRVELSLNGSAVDPLNFDGSQNAPNGQFAVSQWRGVDIHDGDNRFVARVLNSDGSLAQELVRLRFSGQSLDSAAIRRHLAHSGHDALMHEVEKAAAKSGAPFLAADKPLGEARIRWSQAFDASTRVAALEDALAHARDVPGQDEAFRRLKAERDALRRAIKAGTIWEDSAGA